MESSVCGVPVVFSWWMIVLGAIIWIDALTYIRKRCKTHGVSQYITPATIMVFVVFVSVALHEFGHGVAAWFLGIKIAKAGFTGWGAYVIPATDISSLAWYKEVLIAIAGPATNVLIAAMLAIPVKLMDESITENSIQYGSYINIRLARLNMLPFLMLDGAKVLHGLVTPLFGREVAYSIVAVASIATLVYYLFFRPEKTKGLEDCLETM